jgi:O-antigen/teichoic acid export membrane protein
MAEALIIEKTPPPAVELRTDTLADSVLLILALTVVQRMVGFVRALLFCRWLTPEQLGQWDMAFGFLMLAAPASVLAISGAFGRYAEHYRQQGKLQVLIRRTVVFCGLLAVAAAAAMQLTRHWFAELIFGSPHEGLLVVVLAGTLVTCIGFNYLTDLFTGLRSARLIAGLQMLNTVAFAVLSIAMLKTPYGGSASIVVAYGAACLLSVIWAMGPLRRIWRACPDSPGRLPHRVMWPKLISFAAWFWTGSFLTNVFDIVDRYMILHYLPTSAEEALAQIGHYHAARVVPLLLITLAWLLSTIITPYLCHDWERGRRDRVAAHLNLFLKLVGLSLSAAATLALLGGPWLFNVAFGGQHAAGLAVFPFTLIYCTWLGMSLILQNYLWCSEKARLNSVALLVALLLNVAMNLLMLPRMGLMGAVMARVVANLVALLLVCGFNRWLGFRLDRGGWLTMAVPLCYGFGPWVIAICWAAVLLLILRSHWIFSAAEKHELIAGSLRYVHRFKGLYARQAAFFGRAMDSEIP